MRGTTLVELVVALTVCALLAALAAVGVTRPRAAGAERWHAVAGRARAAAIATGRAVSLADTANGPSLFLPDGRAIGAGLDPLLGDPLDASR